MALDPVLFSSATAIAERAINAALNYSPLSQKRVTSLAGKTIAIAINDNCVELLFQESTILLHFVPEQSADNAQDAIIYGSPLSLLRLAVSKDKTLNLEGSEVRVEGDDEVVHRFYALTNSLNIDYEAIIAEVVGSVPAHVIGRRFRSFSRWLNVARQSLEKNIEEYLQEEGRQVPSRVETEIAFEDIDELNLSIDRLDARLQRLEAKIADKPSS